MNPALKPCPFCGAGNPMVVGEVTYAVQCAKCHAKTKRTSSHEEAAGFGIAKLAPFVFWLVCTGERVLAERRMRGGCCLLLNCFVFLSNPML